MMFPRRLALCALALGAVVPARASGLRMEASTVWAENITHSAAPIDWRDTFRFEARGDYDWLRQWAQGLVTTAGFDAGLVHTPRFTNSDAFTAGFHGLARQKFGFGAMAPVVSFDAGLEGRAARTGGDDGWTANAGLHLSKRLTTSWRVSANTDWQQHYAHSSIFDTRHRRVYGTVNWDLTRNLQLSYGRGRLWGDFTANASPIIWPRALSGGLGPEVQRYYNAISWGATDEYGPGWVTYRVYGRVTFWWLELSPALGPHTSLPLRYDSLFSVNKVGIKYRQDVWTVSVLHHF